MELRVGIMMGRLSNGLQSDHGKIYHAVPKDGKKVPSNNTLGYRFIYPAICGATPGKRSVGWAYDKDVGEDFKVSCPRCLKKLG